MKKTKAMLSAAMIAVGAVLCAGRGFGPAAKVASAAKAVPTVSAAAEVVRDGEYCSKGEVAAYIRRFGGALPKNFITKSKARALGWRGGPLEPFAPGKSIGGDRFGNYEGQLPKANKRKYFECDIDYKSGNQAGATYTETELYNGQKLQLLVYLRAVMENLGLTPVGFYYFNVHDKFVKPNQKSYFYSGRTLDNLEIAQSIDHELNQGKSTRLGISINKDGSISAKSNIITASQINAEIDYAVMMIANAGKLIKQGYVSINPLEGACSYCDYSSICDYQDVLTYPPRKSPAATAQTIEEIVNNAKDN